MDAATKQFLEEMQAILEDSITSWRNASIERHEVLVQKLELQASTPVVTTDGVVGPVPASSGTAELVTAAVVATDISFSTAKAPEVFHDASSDCIEMAHVTCSTECSHQVTTTDIVNEVPDATAAISLEPAEMFEPMAGLFDKAHDATADVKEHKDAHESVIPLSITPSTWYEQLFAPRDPCSISLHVQMVLEKHMRVINSGLRPAWPPPVQINFSALCSLGKFDTDATSYLFHGNPGGSLSCGPRNPTRAILPSIVGTGCHVTQIPTQMSLTTSEQILIWCSSAPSFLMTDNWNCSSVPLVLSGFSPSFCPVVMLELQLARSGNQFLYLQKLHMDRSGIEGATLHNISINEKLSHHDKVQWQPWPHPLSLFGYNQEGVPFTPLMVQSWLGPSARPQSCAQSLSNKYLVSVKLLAHRPSVHPLYKLLLLGYQGGGDSCCLLWASKQERHLPDTAAGQPKFRWLSSLTQVDTEIEEGPYCSSISSSSVGTFCESNKVELNNRIPYIVQQDTDLSYFLSRPQGDGWIYQSGVMFHSLHATLLSTPGGTCAAHKVQNSRKFTSSNHLQEETYIKAGHLNYPPDASHYGGEGKELARASPIWLVAWTVDGLEFSTSCKQAPFQGGRNVIRVSFFDQAHVSCDYYLDHAYHFKRGCIDLIYYSAAYHGDCSKTKAVHMPWDPGKLVLCILRKLRLGDKPNFKEGGMLGTYPTPTLTGLVSWANTWAGPQRAAQYKNLGGHSDQTIP